jgi:hypothetical protein
MIEAEFAHRIEHPRHINFLRLRYQSQPLLDGKPDHGRASRNGKAEHDPKDRTSGYGLFLSLPYLLPWQTPPGLQVKISKIALVLCPKGLSSSVKEIRIS